MVLFAHGCGSGCHCTANQYVAEVIREEGVAVLLLDLLTREELLDAETRQAAAFDIGLLARRLADATEWLAAQPALASMKLAYFGDSTGSAAALAAAATEEQVRIEAIVCRGGRPDLADEWLARVKSPTLLVVGTNDPAVQLHNQEAFEQLRCQKALKIIEGCTHTVQDAGGGLEAVAQCALEWLLPRLRPTPAPAGLVTA
jgi:dienelactone hydrolase